MVGIHQKILPVLFEMARYIKDLTLDPVEPDIDTIKDYLSGRIVKI